MTSRNFEFTQWQKNNKVQGLARKIQQNGFAYLATHGLPNKQQEDWKYTKLPLNLHDLLNEYLVTNESLQSTTQKKSSWNSSQLKKIETELQPYIQNEFINIVLVDGVPCEPLSQWKLANQYLQITAIQNREAYKKSIHQFKILRKSIAPVRQDAMEAMNSAFHKTGLIIHLPDNQSVPKPIQIIYYQTQKYYYPKCFLTVGNRSHLKFIETFVGGSALHPTQTDETSDDPSKNQHLMNSTTEISLHENARLGYVRLQKQNNTSLHVGCTRVYLQKNSNFESLSYNSGAAISRHNLDVLCLGAEAFASVNGLNLSQKNQHHDHHTNIEHVIGGATTTQLYKSILADQSRFVFDGRVHIRPQAQKAYSEQLNNNLLLSDQAEADSKPQLEIYADDVKATHGSTVGQLNAEEIFYLQSRAISTEQAIKMLSLGYVYDLLQRITSLDIQTWLGKILKDEFNEKFSQVTTKGLVK